LELTALYDPARHETLTARPWHAVWVRQAIARIVQAAQAEFDVGLGAWPVHPQDDPEQSGELRLNLYWGAAGVVWALRELHAHGSEAATAPAHDWAPFIATLHERLEPLVAAEQHGSASYLFGHSGVLLLQWMVQREPAVADALYAVVQNNLHNPALEPLWGSSGSLVAALHMARASGEVRWMYLLQEGLRVLVQQMVWDEEAQGWLWEQDLYGRRSRFLGAGHGLAGNVYPALAGAAEVQAELVHTLAQRALQTLTNTALRTALAGQGGADGREAWNWQPVCSRERTERALAQGYKPLVQDCHGAPGVVVRLAGAPRTPAWETLLRAAGEMAWLAGPVAKGPSLCHGSAGSAMACLKLWRRFAEPHWLARARALAVHAAEQVEAARSRHGHGRHSLWTGDLGVALTLHACSVPDDRFPTLDHF
jgi:hypothetical protein